MVLMQEKAYKLLALQEKISHSKAKDLIDRGLVFVNGQKIAVARSLLNSSVKFKIKKMQDIKIIFEDEKIIAVNKPNSLISENLQELFKARLLNRLDKETSGLILLCKDENFRQLCINEFKKQRVFKSYIAILDGIIAQEIEINEPMLTTKGKSGAISKISKQGLEANSLIIPLMVAKHKSLVKIIIKTGRTHQIRLHTSFIKHGVIGDEKYAKIKADRMYLHSFEIGLLDYKFKALPDDSFSNFGFELKNFDF